MKVAPFTAPITGLRSATMAFMQFILSRPAEVIHAELLCLLEVDPGAERRVGASEHHRPDLVVRVGPPQGGVQRLEQFGAQRVSHLGTVHHVRTRTAPWSSLSSTIRGRNLAALLARSNSGCGSAPEREGDRGGQR